MTTTLAPQFVYHGTVDRVVDGDTIDVELDLGFNVKIKLRTRLFGLNAPELSTVEGKALRGELMAMLPRGEPIVVRTYRSAGDKFGRWLAIIDWPRGNFQINQWLLDQKLAVPFLEK